MIPMRLLGTGSVLPGRRVPTDEVSAAAWPGRDPADVRARTGIDTRHWHVEGETVASVSAECLRRALDAAGLDATRLKRLILVNSLGFDTVMPATANRVAAALGLRNTLDCFDVSNACTGFVTGLDLGARSVATGLFPVAVVATELISRFIAPSNPRPYAILADASGAVILDRAGPDDGGLLGTWYGNDGFLGDSVTLEHNPVGGEKALIQFGGSNERITEEAVSSIAGSARKALAEAGLGVSDIDWFLLHQPNGVMFRRVAAALGVDEARTVPVVHEVGSVGSASIPLALDRLVRSGRLRPGATVLMAAVGSGLSYGAVVWKVGRPPACTPA